MHKDLYSLTENSERFTSIVDLFKYLNSRTPSQGEEITCYHHCPVMKKSFLQTFFAK
jgi:hypothetical protein